jgi:hypothetical protein
VLLAVWLQLEDVVVEDLVVHTIMDILTLKLNVAVVKSTVKSMSVVVVMTMMLIKVAVVHTN